jgi:hypothetical protein
MEKLAADMAHDRKKASKQENNLVHLFGDMTNAYVDYLFYV